MVRKPWGRSSSAQAQDTNSFTSRFFASLFTRLTQWFADATNGITDFFAKIGHFDEVRAKKLCAGSTCINEQQLAAILQGAAGAPGLVSGIEAPGGSPASGDADTTLTLNGNNPVAWQMGTLWQDNLGALFTHGGQSETVYSTSTIDTAAAGTSTIDYWAQVPDAQWLHATRDAVISALPTITNSRRERSNPRMRTIQPQPHQAHLKPPTTTSRQRNSPPPAPSKRLNGALRAPAKEQNP